MIELQISAQELLNDYMGRLRAHLYGCHTVDPSEVERDVQEHIERELQDLPKPVSYNALQGVLTELGSPAQWVPEEEIPWWRKSLIRLQKGPEDWRLAYFSLILLVFGFIYDNYLPVLAPVSFLCSRAALSLVGDSDKLGARKWFLYPSLIAMYLFVAFWIIVGPVILFFGVATQFDHLDFQGQSVDVFPWNTPSKMRDVAYYPIAFSFVAGLTGLYWLLLGIAHKQWPRVTQAIFRPFVKGNLSGASNGFIAMAIILLALGTAAGVLMLCFQGWYDYLVEHGIH